LSESPEFYQVGQSPTAGVGNLYIITGRVNYALSLADRKFNPKILRLSNYEEK